MKTLFKSLFSLSLIMSMSPAAMAQTGASATGSSSAEVVNPLTIEETQTLSFGAFAASNQAGTVESQAGGSTTNITMVGTDTRTPGKFEVEGEPNSSFTVALSDVLPLSGPGDDMNANLALISPPSGLSGAGNAEITVSGTLDVGANQAVGDYAGSYKVTVNYQ